MGYYYPDICYLSFLEYIVLFVTLVTMEEYKQIEQQRVLNEELHAIVRGYDKGYINFEELKKEQQTIENKLSELKLN